MIGLIIILAVFLFVITAAIIADRLRIKEAQKNKRSYKVDINFKVGGKEYSRSIDVVSIDTTPRAGVIRVYGENQLVIYYDVLFGTTYLEVITSKEEIEIVSVNITKQ